MSATKAFDPATRPGPVLAIAPSSRVPRKRVLILVENLPVPPDRRVWQEATALRDAGFSVTIICPKGKGWNKSRETIDGIDIFRHWLPEAHGPAGYVLEYATAILSQTWLAWRVFLASGFDVVQACNPPDLLFLVALQFRPFGVRFVFDHHDPAVELFKVKFPRFRRLARTLALLERTTLRLADLVIAPNEMFQTLDMAIGRKTRDRTAIVLSAPDLGPQLSLPPDPSLRRGRPFMALYVGVMGSQDGVDILLDAAAHLVRAGGRDDIQFVLAGDGPECPALRERAASLGLLDHVTFLGFVTGETLWRALRTADVGLCPDPRNDFNDRLTMNKLLEYMAFGLPSVSFDLAMSRRLVGQAGIIVESDEASAFGDAVGRLLDDEERRRRLGAAARSRFASDFAWQRQADALVVAYERLLSPAPAPAAMLAAPCA